MKRELPTKFKPFEKALKDNPLIACIEPYEEYLSIQLSTPLGDGDDAILLYLIDEGDGEFSLSDSAWIYTLLPYENPSLTEKVILIEAERKGFSANGMTLYAIVNPDTLASKISDFDELVRVLQGFDA